VVPAESAKASFCKNEFKNIRLPAMAGEWKKDFLNYRAPAYNSAAAGNCYR